MSHFPKGYDPRVHSSIMHMHALLSMHMHSTFSYRTDLKGRIGHSLHGGHYPQKGHDERFGPIRTSRYPAFVALLFTLDLNEPA